MCKTDKRYIDCPVCRTNIKMPQKSSESAVLAGSTNFEEEISSLKKKLDTSHDLINRLYESGCLQIVEEQWVQKYFNFL